MDILFNSSNSILIVHPDELNYYMLLLVLGTMTPLKINILMILSHLNPRQLTATQLTELLGYSKNSRVIYRGVLDELSGDNLILIEKVTTKKFSIRLNTNHPQMRRLHELCISHGEEMTTSLENILEGVY